MITQGVLYNKAPVDIQEKNCPHGDFEGVKGITSETIDIQGGFDDVYRILLVDMPIGPYSDEHLKQAGRDKDEMALPGLETSQVSGIITIQDREIMKPILKLEVFYEVVMYREGTTAEVMDHVLKMEDSPTAAPPQKTGPK